MLCRFCRTANPETAVTCYACGVPLSKSAVAVAPEQQHELVQIRHETAAPTLPQSQVTGVNSTAPLPAPPLPAGTKLRDGLFAIGRVLRQTSFGTVYLGSDATTRQPVSITELCLAGSTRQERHVLPAHNIPPEVNDRAQH